MALELTHHAEQRWRERCAGLDPEAEWQAARKVGQKLWPKLKASCPAHEAGMTRSFSGVYYLFTHRSRIAWVAAPPERIITVFRM
ncbi:hypothetical protein [Azospirillum himalayense]|uniref:Type II toxin-antitoxin system RelE/ParE family toxin n=1 Tax=Azospirillum himalayense TaxID=654847 RepID=A0ABW0FZG4_9PROT